LTPTKKGTTKYIIIEENQLYILWWLTKFVLENKIFKMLPKKIQNSNFIEAKTSFSIPYTTNFYIY
jgi:hypothetical protein